MLDTYEGGQPTVGRGAELEEIEALLDSLQTGDSGFLEVVGEPGIGKSTLLAALIERAEARGLLALRGRASQFELETPFDPFVDALDDYLATINPRRWAPLGSERMGELGSTFPSIAELVEEPGSILPSEERYRIHR
jgi:predicted ATPase